MKTVSVHKTIHLLACVALVLQFIAPGALVARNTDQLSISDFLCIPSGEISETAKTAVEAWSKLVHKPNPADSHTHKQCPLCVVAEIALFEGAQFKHTIHQYWRATVKPLRAIGGIAPAQGPPLGLRAPPQSH